MFTALGLFAGKVAANPALRKIAYIIGAILAACLGIYLVREQAKGEQRDTDKKREVKATVKTIQVIEKASEHEAQVAIAAGESVPHVDSDRGVDSLPDGPAIASRIFRPEGS